MSQRAAWQFERLGFSEVYDFVLGKAHWLASGRPTVRQEPIERVGGFLKDPPTAHIDDVATDAVSGLHTTDDVVVVDEGRRVLGRATNAAIRSATGATTMAEIMKLGPTTIRPDELCEAVRKRMASRKVSSILVTAPTGLLLGQYVPEEA